MGQNQSHNPKQLHAEAKLAASRFRDDEMHILKKTWEDLAERSNGKGIDKETFLQYFPLSGLLGERLFSLFNVKANGYIDMDEFITGLAMSSRGTKDEKIHFIFNMYDTSHGNTVSKEDLTTLLNHVPKYVLAPLREEHVAERIEAGHLETPQGDGSVSVESAQSMHDYDDIDLYTNHRSVQQAFEECDVTHCGRLNYEEFKMWIERNPRILEYMDSILPFASGAAHVGAPLTQKEALPLRRTLSVRKNSVTTQMIDTQNLEGVPNLKRTSSRQYALSASGTPTMKDRNVSQNSLETFELAHISTSGGSAQNSPPPVQLNAVNGDVNEGSPVMQHPFDDEEYAKMCIIHAMEATTKENVRNALCDILKNEYGEYLDFNDDTTKKIVTKEGYLYKKGGLLHLWSKRWYLLNGNCIYYYAHKKDVRPRGVIFLMGSIIEKIVDDSSEMKGHFGFEILHQDMCTGEHHRHEQRVLYCRSEKERDLWIQAVQQAADVVPIEDEYVIGKELGRGRFSRVCECVNKVTGEHCAVKIIEKSTIAPEEKSLLRTEIAVLKLVDHPNIIRMVGQYESKNLMYIVMEKLEGGELFERIVGKPRFSEEDASRLLRPLLESVAYLHDLGIVHRDLKPENILCGDSLDDIKIADFGLSKMLLPKERMDTACGTLSYVAPEVLTLSGYGQETDLWSIGVVLFLLLCGKLPFDGNTQEEIIHCTIQAELKVSPNVWNKLSVDGQSLIKSLLQRNPRERITATDALRHPFLTKYGHVKRTHSMQHVHDGHSVASGGASTVKSR